MTEQAPGGSSTAPDQSLSSDFRQGDVLPRLTRLVVMTAGGRFRRRGRSRIVDAPEGSVVLSQTCDLVRPEPPTVQVARVVRLDEAKAREARDGKRPRYVHVPAIGQDGFADLDVVVTIDKTYLATFERQPGVESDDDVRTFGRAVSRRYGRFPFPDEVVPWLQPLEKLVGSRSRKPGSSEGQLLDRIVEIRIEAPGGWMEPPYDLTLAIIVQPGVLPTFPDDEPPDCPPDLAAWLYDEEGAPRVSSAMIAERLLAHPPPAESHWLWDALGQSWASQCRPDAQRATKAILDGVSSISADVVSSDEFSLHRSRRSEQLDIDHLSPPAPR